jgi:hypothetical protein
MLCLVSTLTLKLEVHISYSTLKTLLCKIEVFIAAKILIVICWISLVGGYQFLEEQAASVLRIEALNQLPSMNSGR